VGIGADVDHGAELLQRMPEMWRLSVCVYFMMGEKKKGAQF
jgi:hypothetical protein